MDINEFADALARLSIHKIGIVEAATLLACRDGLTTDQVSERFRIPKSVAIGRVAVLLRKGFVRSLYEEQGDRKIVPTAEGKAIIETATTPTK